MKNMKHNVMNQLLLIYSAITATYFWVQLIQNNYNRSYYSPNQHKRHLLQDEEHNFNDNSEEIAVGSVLGWAGSIDEIQEGWKLCNGENNTPNLTDVFIIGAGNLYNIHDTGGQIDIELQINQLPSHNHQLHNESIIIEESDDEHYHHIFDEDITVSLDQGHKHKISTNNISYNGEHFHTSNYSLSSEGEHIHKVVRIERRFFNFNPTTAPTESTLNPTNNPSTSNPTLDPTSNPTANPTIFNTNAGAPTTNIDTADYSIDYELTNIPINNGLATGSAGSHTHCANLGTNAAGNHQHTTINFGGPGLSDFQGQHAHSVSGTTCGPNVYHTHSISGSLNLDISDVYTTSKGIHSHIIYGQSNINGMHSHTLETTSNNNGKHNHVVSGQTDHSADNHTHEIYFSDTESVGNNHKINIINPYYSLAYIIKTSGSILNEKDEDSKSSSEKDQSMINQTRLTSVSTAAIILSVIAVIFVIILCCVWGFLMYKTYDNDNENESEYGEDDEQHNENDTSSTKTDLQIQKQENNVIPGVLHAPDIELHAINTSNIGEVIDNIDNIDNIQNHVDDKVYPNLENDGIDTIESVFK